VLQLHRRAPTTAAALEDFVRAPRGHARRSGPVVGRHRRRRYGKSVRRLLFAAVVYGSQERGEGTPCSVFDLGYTCLMATDDLLSFCVAFILSIVLTLL
jgi:hypothetical protein